MTVQLREAYAMWCDENAEKLLGLHNFGEKLRGRGYVTKKTRGITFWRDMGLHPEEGHAGIVSLKACGQGGKFQDYPPYMQLREEFLKETTLSTPRESLGMLCTAG